MIDRSDTLRARLAGYMQAILADRSLRRPGRERFPDLIPTPAELPATLRPLAEQALPRQADVWSIFFVPAQTFLQTWFGLRYVPEQALLFTSQGVLHVQAPADPDQPPSTAYFQAADLLYTRLSLLLLYGRLELIGSVGGDLTRVEVEFNTVGEYLLRPPLEQFLQLTWGQTRVDLPPESQLDATLKQLTELPLKFNNGLRHRGLQPAERLLGFVFQPAIWVPRWRFLWRQVSATTLLALTDRQVVLVQEPMEQRTTYGWIFTYCPLACLAEVEAKTIEGWSQLTLSLRRDKVAEEHRIMLEPDTAQAWADLWQQYSLSVEGG